jgi:hypothetical protein
MGKPNAVPRCHVVPRCFHGVPGAQLAHEQIDIQTTSDSHVHLLTGSHDCSAHRAANYPGGRLLVGDSSPPGFSARGFLSDGQLAPSSGEGGVATVT